MKILTLLPAGLLVGMLVAGGATAQYQPVESHRPATPPPPITPSQGIPVNQIPQSGGPVQSVPEPDAPDEGDMQTPAAMPPGGQTQGIVQPPEGALPGNQANPRSPVATPAVSPPDLSQGETDFSSVVLRGLNKVTARAETIDAPIGSSVRFRTIEIIAHRCWKAAPEERPENAALLEISEIKQGEPPAQIFLGWMFSSSPALSALEHPFYDLTVIACKKDEIAPRPAAAEKKSSKAAP